MAPKSKMVVNGQVVTCLSCVHSFWHLSMKDEQEGLQRKIFHLKQSLPRCQLLLCFSTTGWNLLPVHKPPWLWKVRPFSLDLTKDTFLTNEQHDFYFILTNCVQTYIFILSYSQSTTLQCLINITPTNAPFLALKNPWLFLFKLGSKFKFNHYSLIPFNIDFVS